MLNEIQGAVFHRRHLYLFRHLWPIAMEIAEDYALHAKLGSVANCARISFGSNRLALAIIDLLMTNWYALLRSAATDNLILV
jgi:hypothetical protein